MLFKLITTYCQWLTCFPATQHSSIIKTCVVDAALPAQRMWRADSRGFVSPQIVLLITAVSWGPWSNSHLSTQQRSCSNQSPAMVQSIYISGDNIWYWAVYNSVLLSVHCSFYAVYSAVLIWRGTAPIPTVQCYYTSKTTVMIHIETCCLHWI